MTLSFDNPPSILRLDDGDRRLIMRPARVADAAEIVAALKESETELRGFMQWVFVPQTIELQSKRLGATEKGFGKGGDIILHLYEREDGPLLGTIGLHRGRMFNRLGFEIGFWMRSSAAGRGWMTLAVQCVVVLGFECMGLERVQCGYNEANAASQRVSEKVGFSVEGRLRHFENTPTQSMREGGCEMAEHLVMTALFPSDRAELDWYPQIAASLRVFDGNGQSVWPASQ